MVKNVLAWLVICLVSAVAVIYGVRALDEQAGVREKLGLGKSSQGPVPSPKP